MNEPRRVSHDDTVVEMLKADPDFANEYVAAALEEAELPGGQTALLAALRHIAETQGMTAVASRAGTPPRKPLARPEPQRQPDYQDIFRRDSRDWSALGRKPQPYARLNRLEAA